MKTMICTMHVFITPPPSLHKKKKRKKKEEKITKNIVYVLHATFQKCKIYPIEMHKNKLFKTTICKSCEKEVTFSK